MRISRVYHPESLTIDEDVLLVSSTALHVAKVLRLPAGSPLILFNGDGYDYLAEIKTLTKQQVTVSIKDSMKLNNESPLNLHLGQAISKSSKMDFAIQKAVELGVKEITPIISARCQIKLSNDRWQNKIDHWKKIIISACEQSGRSFIPTLNQPTEFTHWLGSCHADLKLILNPHTEKKLNQQVAHSIALLIGPEGGFSEEEIKLAITNQFQSIQLGPRILRTETAALAAIANLQQKFGDFA